MDSGRHTIPVNPKVSYRENVLKPVPDKIIRTEFTYAGPTDFSGNVKEVREYDFNGALRRKTQLGYLHEGNGPYIALNLTDRVNNKLVYDGSNVLIERSYIAYDYWPTLYTATGAIRHDSAFGPTYVTRGLPTVVQKFYEVLAAESSRVFDIEFVIPATAGSAILQVGYVRGETSRIPIDLRAMKI